MVFISATFLGFWTYLNLIELIHSHFNVSEMHAKLNDHSPADYKIQRKIIVLIKSIVFLLGKGLCQSEKLVSHKFLPSTCRSNGRPSPLSSPLGTQIHIYSLFLNMPYPLFNLRKKTLLKIKKNRLVPDQFPFKNKLKK
uniref:Uncharacterized protein n=1 Tax=Meloidogyne enterolobii TaxID=390850 RepID=A0A6V7U831_MELEN|nr:unnamed protein product [Meloidogyne enterolobii]